MTHFASADCLVHPSFPSTADLQQLMSMIDSSFVVVHQELSVFDHSDFEDIYSKMHHTVLDCMWFDARSHTFPAKGTLPRDVNGCLERNTLFTSLDASHRSNPLNLSRER